MPQVSLHDGKLIRHTEEIPLLCGEFHYWRHDPLYWEKILDAIEELGLNLIASYICWDFHQTSPGTFDFKGKTHPRRHLKKFLELTQKRGFKLFIRPGPYIYSEWKNLGLPEAAAKVHRMDPQFLKLAQRYMKEVTAALDPFFANRRGGHIVLLQADNEIDPIPGAFEAELGLNGKPGPFHSFLKSKYGKIEKLNAAWGADFKSFTQARGFTSAPGLDARQWRRFYDTREFVPAYSTEKAAWMASEYRKLGVEIPIVFNTYAAFESQNWRDLERAGDLAGVDVYPENELSGGKESHRLFCERIRVMKSYSKAPFVVEFESGLWHGFLHTIGNLKPNHYGLCALSALAAGAVGWNWYMLVNRDNWYQAPINELGDFRLDVKPAFERIVKMHRALKPADLEKLCDAAVTFSYAHYRCGFDPAKDAVLENLYHADLDYAFWDVENEPPKTPLLFYSGEEWLPRREQEGLLRYVQRGGRLVIFQKGPRFDENREPLNLLELPEPEGVLGGREVLGHKKPLAVELGAKERPEVLSELHVYPARVKGALVWARQLPSVGWEKQWHLLDGEKYPAGVRLKRGKGEIWLLGVSPGPELLHALFRHFEVSRGAVSSVPGLHTALFRRKGRPDEYYVIAVNNTPQPLEAAVSLESLGKPVRAAETVPDRSPVSFIPKNNGGDLFFPVPAKNGAVARFFI